MEDKRIILRKEVSTNQMLPKVELIRIVKNKAGEIFIDPTGKANGRGVYLKASFDSLSKVKKTRQLERSLKTKLSEEIYILIENEIKENWG
ncbi:putative RNA-binding protein [Spiroplasma sp. TIUS-1]|uniref:RNase P modulator RnpM n=1 Tax=Spiroplasma sp. TIUS-1 TaxID=216963 RepID=UPI0013986BCE|nr:YlxR family protein [Spiroplasma sp. TIUS-1]QHX35957.1 putative RNA-binding protein [Spiroplasma sp. TIUS-1]